MWRLLRTTLRAASLPAGVCASVFATQGRANASESESLQQRTEPDTHKHIFFAASSQGWFLQCDDGGHLVTPFPGYVPAARELREKFALRGGPNGDIIVATYPKCGTTWMQQIVLLLLAEGQAELVVRPTAQAPWIEMNHGRRQINAFTYEPPEEWRKQGPAARRVFKTHALAGLAPWKGGATVEGIPEGAKVVMVTRNPKDTAVSYYHHGKDTAPYKYTGDWNHFLHKIFLPGIIDFGDFWTWHGTWWRARAQLPPNRILWISYEEMQEDLPRAVRRVADFVNVPVTEDIVQKVVDGASFGKMKKDWAAFEQQQLQETGKIFKKNHIRQGKSGTWREAMSASDSDAIDRAHASRCLAEGLPPSLWNLL